MKKRHSRHHVCKKNVNQSVFVFAEVSDSGHAQGSAGGGVVVVSLSLLGRNGRKCGLAPVRTGRRATRTQRKESNLASQQ